MKMNYAYFSFTRVIAVLALAAGIFVFRPGGLFFLNDDFIHLYLTSKGQWLQQNSFRPVCDLSMWLDYQLWALNATGFHLTNVLIHFACSILVYRFSFLLLGRYHQWAVAGSNAMLIAAIFFLYAFHSETVFWVIGRSASLGTAWFLLSLIFYLQRNESAKGFTFSVLFFALGLLTYESVWITPFVFAVFSYLDVKQRQSPIGKEWKYLLLTAGVMAVYLVVRFLAISQLVGPYEGTRFFNLDIGGLAANMLKLVLRGFSRQSGSLYLLLAAFVTSVAALVSFLLTRKKQFAFAVILLWLTGLIPYLSLGIDTFGSEGERYLYLPSIFFCIIIGLGIVNARQWYKYAITIIFFVVHVLLLMNARNDYETASEATYNTVSELKETTAAQQLYFLCLPGENNGALIFRDGLPEAVKLYAPRAGKVHILSRCGGNFSFTGVTVEDPLSLQRTPAADVVFDYSRSSLLVSYLPPGTISE
ncbi:MAG TPA: hypothetical protein VF145_13910 [Chitinophagaceae bacterium]